jgi:GT2 family glycosyltransferase
VADVELTAPIEAPPPADPSGRRYGRARLLVRLHTVPIGIAWVKPGPAGFTAAEVALAVFDQLGAQINRHLAADGLEPITGLGPGGLDPVESPLCQSPRRAAIERGVFASVIVCTKDRPDVLGRALSAVAALDYPNYETVVIDGSSGPESERLVRAEHPDVRYYRLAAGGRLIVGRDRGLAEARGEVIAYTDDDAVVDRNWLAEHIAGFDAADRIGCTTGLASPLELATPAQVWFEAFGAFGEGIEPRTISLATRERRSLLPYATGRIGSGVSMAFRASVLREIGGFDLALDVAGAEDISAFFDVLCAGYGVAFCPAALVHHEHRRTYEVMRRQVRSYAEGLGTYGARIVLTHPELFLDFARRVPRGMIYALSPSSVRNHQQTADYPAELNRLQLPGMLRGARAYLRGRRMVPDTRARLDAR